MRKTLKPFAPAPSAVAGQFRMMLLKFKLKGGKKMSIISKLYLTNGTRLSDPCRQITALTPESVDLKSNEGYSEVMFDPCDIPENATFLLFEIITKFTGINQNLGNVNVGIQPPPGENSFFRIVQGEFIGTLALQLATVSGEVPWLGIGFPAGAFGAGEFIATVCYLRFVDDTTVPDEQLMDVPSEAPPSAPTNLRVRS